MAVDDNSAFEPSTDTTFEEAASALLEDESIAEIESESAGPGAAAEPDAAPLPRVLDAGERSPYPVITSYKAAARSIELLTREQEQHLGREVLEARLDLARVVALAPGAAAILLGAIEDSDASGDRPLTDLVQHAFGAGAKRVGADGETQGWRDRVAALADAHARWRDAGSAAAARAARVDVARALVDLEPAMPVLREMLAWLRRASNAGNAERARRDTGVDARVLRAIVRRGAVQERRYLRASKHLVEANFRLVFYMANKLVGNGVALEDLVQDGILGLMRAVDKFDYRLGYKFSTYACGWIWQGVTRSVADGSRTVRVAAHMHDLIIKLNKISGGLAQRLGRSPTVAEIAEASDLPEWRVRNALRSAQRPLSLEAPLSQNEDADLKSLVVDENQPEVSEGAQGAEVHRVVDGLLAALPQREAVILKLRHGIGVPEPMTLEEIGRVMGITRERTRQLEARAIEKLRESADPEIVEAVAS